MLKDSNALSTLIAVSGEGTDDYLTQPFELRELELRLAALVQRAGRGLAFL